MRGELEVLIKLVIPAILLIFWALSNLFNRENAAQAKGNSPLGPRPPGYPGPRPAERPRPTPPARQVPPSSSRGDDDILVIRSETNRPAARPGAPARKNPGRGRNPQSSPSRRAEPTPRPREQLGGRISADVQQVITRPFDVRPLTESGPEVIGRDATDSALRDAAGTQLATLDDLRAALTSQRQIREAFVLNELLQRPIALRNRGRAHI